MKTTNYQISRVLLISFVLFLSNTFFATASSTITGHVFNDKKQPLNYATATILNPETMKIVDGDMCNDKGEFIIKNVQPGTYILSVRMLGFEKNESIKINIDSLNTKTEINNIVLKQNYQKLAEVVVTAKLKPSTQSPARTYVSNKKTIEPKSDYLVNQLDFSSSYKSFMKLYDLKSIQLSFSLKPALFIGNYLIKTAL